jgi:lipid II:glycine glycyltransferase (peptidoglycan interpeptide bridge formation enzyme)
MDGSGYPTLRKKREGWGTQWIACAGEKQRQEQLQILRLRSPPHETTTISWGPLLRYAQDDKYNININK